MGETEQGEYRRYRNFEAVVEKGKLACFSSGHRIEDHFADVSKMIEIVGGAGVTWGGQGRGGEIATISVTLPKWSP